MKIEQYREIKEYIRQITEGTEWEGNIYTVGGCVRDEIMGSEIKDIDMCVTRQGGGVRFAEWLHQNNYTTNSVTLYPNYGTAMLHLKAFPDVELEFVQTRKEKYVDHTCRNPETAFGSMGEDCMRRDLTINALYSSISTGEIIDITGKGIDDIKHHVVRTPNDPDVIYDDDPLRILRCIRFASRYGWDIEEGTYAGMLRNIDRLSIITHERIRDELNKMLTCKHPVMAMELLRETGAMRYVIPELIATYDMEQNKYHFGTVWEHTMSVVERLKGSKPKLMVAALLHDIGKIVTRTEVDGKVHFKMHEVASAEMVNSILRRLKYSNDFICEVQFLVKNHMLIKSFGNECNNLKPKQLRKLQYLCGSEERYHDLMRLIDADNKSHSPEHCLPRQVEIIERMTAEMKADGTTMFDYQLPINGWDVMQIKGLKPGHDVKRCLDYLQKVAFVNPKSDRDELIKLLKSYKLS
jgi:poly(A) polymerase